MGCGQRLHYIFCKAFTLCGTLVNLSWDLYFNCKPHQKYFVHYLVCYLRSFTMYSFKYMNFWYIQLFDSIEFR